ncbi:MAG: hypothetical protein ACI4BD_08550 [Paludibacteraceae bacterium]
MNNNFESQLSASARRLREAQDARLTTAPRHNYRSAADSNYHFPSEERCDSPTAKKRTVWHWLTAPVAAACGLLIGLCIPIQHRPTTLITKQQSSSTSTSTILPATAHAGSSIMEDGADYTLFVSF